MPNWFERKRTIVSIVLLMVLAFLMSRFEGVMDVIGKLLAILSPFIIGTVIALLVNLPMRFLERHLKFFNRNHVLRRIRRPVCLLLSVLFVAAIVFLIMLVIIPEVVAAVENTVRVLPGAIKQAVDWINSLGLTLRSNLNLTVPTETDVQGQIEDIYNFLVGGIMGSTAIIQSAANWVMNTVIGFIFAIYLLASKERLMAQFRSLTTAYLKRPTADRVQKVFHLSVDIFSDFISGQCLQALSSALLTWGFLALCGIPYAVLISLLVFITAFIPIFGPYISGALGIILVYSQDAALIWWFLLIFFIVQQVSGSLIYPRIMASAIDLPSIWVLVSVTVGGGLMGLAGIKFFIPFTAVLCNLLGEDVARRHALKNQTPDMRHA